ncbi:MAG: PAS domain-containing protein [Microcoleus vaginatus WJT46-NPBG5]|nr:PAS domain-containing protein [Microcoleus vaginatus WJT46-NPBG5]
MQNYRWLNLPHNHPDRLPTFRGAIVGLTLALVGFSVLAGVMPVLIVAPALFAAALMLPLPPMLVALMLGQSGLLTLSSHSSALLGHDNVLLTRYSIAVGSATVLGVLARRFLLGIEWQFASRNLLASLLEADTTATPEVLLTQALSSLRQLARADAAIALHQLDEVTAEALVCLPHTALPDKLTTPKLFAEALAQNRCLYYADYPSSAGAAPVLVGQGTQSLAVLPLQDAGNRRGAILLLWYRHTEISWRLRRLMESLLAGVRTLLRFQNTTFHFEKLQARYSAILETIPQGVVFVDESGEQSWLNHAAAKQLNLTPGSVEPVMISQAMAKLRTSAENHEVIAQQAVKFFSQPQAEIRDWLWVCANESPSQDDTWPAENHEPNAAPVPEGRTVLSLSSTPTRVRDVPGRLWLLDNVTEGYFSRLALVERTQQLEIVNQELEAFSHSVAHDLRAPLASIDAFSLLLLRGYAEKLDEEGVDDLQSIRIATARMRQLIDDLLQLARVARTEMRREVIDVTGLAQAVANNLKKTQPARQVEWVIAADVVAKVDGPLLQIVFENLLGNAWKYTSKHQNARIEFGVLPQPADQTGLPSPSPIYFVRDDGAGFDMTYADKLFGTFQRLHRPSEFEGTGVGLATVQRIIHRQGGRIWAEAQVEKGATFYFTL